MIEEEYSSDGEEKNLDAPQEQDPKEASLDKADFIKVVSWIREISSLVLAASAAKSDGEQGGMSAPSLSEPPSYLLPVFDMVVFPAGVLWIFGILLPQLGFFVAVCKTKNDDNNTTPTNSSSGL